MQFDQDVSQTRSETCARNGLRGCGQNAIFYVPEYAPKPRRVSDGIAGAYIATSKEEPQQ